MKKLLALMVAVLACATAAFAAPPGKVVKVEANAITLHWDAKNTGMSQHHGLANGGVQGTSRQFTYRLTPQTTYWQAGKQVALSNIQKGATVQVTAVHGVASRIDLM
jgi:hypothetical protein